MAYARPDTLPEIQLAGSGRGYRTGRGRGVVLAAAAAAVVIGLVGWLLAGVISGPSRAAGAAGGSLAGPAARPTQAVATVQVSQGTLVGQPVVWVRRQLIQLGLRVRVQWQPSDQQRPGTVLSVQPGGRVAVGSHITVVAVFQQGHHDHHGHGNGDGKGNGNQGD